MRFSCLLTVCRTVAHRFVIVWILAHQPISNVERIDVVIRITVSIVCQAKMVVCTRAFHSHFKRRWCGMMAIVLTMVHQAMQLPVVRIQGNIYFVVFSFTENCVTFFKCKMFLLFFSSVDFPRCDLHRQYNNQVVTNGLQNHPSRSRSVPEGLAHVSTQPGFECHCSRNHWRSQSFRHPNRSVQVVEQITTSV